MANKRHVEYSTEELEAKRMLLTPTATKRANLNAAKSLRDFLRQKRQVVNFEDFSPEQLNEVLGHFYMGVRTEKNELYRGKSLQVLRYGLNRYLSCPPHNKPFNIMSGSQFHSSNELFRVAMQELKAEGKEDVKHTPAINQEDLKKPRLVASATVTSQQTIRQDVELSNDEVAALFDPEYEPAMPPTRQNPPIFHHCDLSHATINIQFH